MIIRDFLSHSFGFQKFLGANYQTFLKWCLCQFLEHIFWFSKLVKAFFCWIWMLICFRIFEFIIGNWFSIFWWVFEAKKFSSTLNFWLLWSCTEELDKICNLTIFVFLISLICRTHLLEYIYFPYQFGNLRMSTLWKIECFLTKAKKKFHKTDKCE